MAFQFDGVVQVAGAQVLLPALAVHQPRGGAVGGQVGVVEVAFQGEQTEGMAQLPLVVQLVVQARAQRFGAVVDVVALGVAISGLAANIGRAPGQRIAGDAAIGGAVIAAVFVLHQPVQLGGDLPAHGRGEQLAVIAVDAVAEAVLVLVAQVQAQAEGVAGVGAEVGVQAAQVLAAALGLDGRAAAVLRRLAHPVDDAALAATAIEHRRRALEHLDPLDVVQVAGVLAVVADAVQVEVVAGVEAADAQAVEAGVGAAADVGDAFQRLAQVAAAVVQHVAGLHRVDGLRHIARRGRGTGRGGHVLDPRVVLFAGAVGGHRGFRQGRGGGTGQAGAEQQRQAQGQGGKAAGGRHRRRPREGVRNLARMVMLAICCCIDICKGLSLHMFQNVAIHLNVLSLGWLSYGCVR